MVKTELIKLARELHSIHGLMPVPVAGKIPLGGTGWNLLPLESRIAFISSPACTGIGIQMGLVFHPYYGPVEARGIDCDIDDISKSMLFAKELNNYFQPTHWRWGRRPASLVFTNPGIIKREQFGPIQLLGNGKQIVFWGAYQNKAPLPSDPPEYWMEGRSIFDYMPPFVPADRLKTAVECACAAAGSPIIQARDLTNAVPLTSADLAMLTADTLDRFRTDIKSMLSDIEQSPTGSGRGTKLFSLGIRYGALIKASGQAPVLLDAAVEVSPDYVDYGTIDNPILSEIGKLAEETFAVLPGSLGRGDKRDFARGVGGSKGLAQTVDVAKQKHALPMPSGRSYPAQTATDLLAKDLAPLRYMVPRYLADNGCIVLAGKPKVGKGWIIMELGMRVAEAGRFWGEQCEQHEVLMYMLEDSDRRCKERMNILHPFFSAGDRMRFRYAVDGPFYVNADGTGTLLDDIREHIRCFPHIKLIVIDVLQRIRGEEKRTDNAYQADYRIIGALQKLATEQNVLIIVVHHTKKGRVDDAIDSINGSFGVIGAADGGIIIGKDGDVMKIESRMRDIPDYEFNLVKEDDSPMWKPAQTAAELLNPPPGNGTKGQTVVNELRKAACSLTGGDIAIRTGISEKNVGTYLMRLLKNNQVKKLSRGYYIAEGTPERDRIHGVVDLLKRVPKFDVTIELKQRYAPNFEVPPDACYMLLYDVAIKEIEAGFVHGKACLQSLKHRGLAVFNSDTVWLIGDEWKPKELKPQPNPFAFKYPWEV